jgi:hypothetical protein
MKSGRYSRGILVSQLCPHPLAVSAKGRSDTLNLNSQRVAMRAKGWRKSPAPVLLLLRPQTSLLLGLVQGRELMRACIDSV